MQYAGPALQATSLIMGAVGDYEGKGWQAQQLKNRAQQGRIQAAQVDTAHREELTSKLAGIDAIRASAGVSANSPTALGIRAGNEATSDRNRTCDVANREMQARQDEADAKYLLGARKFTLFGGVANGLVPFADALWKPPIMTGT